MLCLLGMSDFELIYLVTVGGITGGVIVVLCLLGMSDFALIYYLVTVGGFIGVLVCVLCLYVLLYCLKILVWIKDRCGRDADCADGGFLKDEYALDSTSI